MNFKVRRKIIIDLSIYIFIIYLYLIYLYLMYLYLIYLYVYKYILLHFMILKWQLVHLKIVYYVSAIISRGMDKEQCSIIYIYIWSLYIYICIYMVILFNKFLWEKSQLIENTGNYVIDTNSKFSRNSEKRIISLERKTLSVIDQGLS